MHKRVAYNAIDDRRTARVACVRTPAYENVLFTILRWQPLGATEIQRLVTSNIPGWSSLREILRVIHLQQIRFDRSGSLVVIHASRIQKSERVERSERSISPVTAGLWLLVVGILSPETTLLK